MSIIFWIFFIVNIIKWFTNFVINISFMILIRSSFQHWFINASMIINIWTSVKHLRSVGINNWTCVTHRSSITGRIFIWPLWLSIGIFSCLNWSILRYCCLLSNSFWFRYNYFFSYYIINHIFVNWNNFCSFIIFFWADLDWGWDCKFYVEILPRNFSLKYLNISFLIWLQNILQLMQKVW